MANTKIPIELSSTPSIVDNGDATAITIDSSERVNINKTSATTGHPVEIQANTSGQGMGIYGRSADDFSFLGFYENGANTELSSLRSNSGFLGINTGGTQRLRIDSDGLKFGTDTAAANALDDYEEGTWSPTIIGSSGASGQSYSLQNGRYRIIGKFVALSFDVQLSAKGTLSGPYVLLGGHGFTFQGANLGGTATIAYAANVSNQTDPMFAYINNSNIYLMLGGTTSYITTAGGYINDNSRIIGSVTGFLL